MGKFVKGDIVVLPFPFSNLSQSKRRPAIVLADLKGEDIILCQITSQAIRDEYAIPLDPSDFSEGSLPKKSNVRPNRIFTADKAIIIYKAGHVNKRKVDAIIKKLWDILAL